MNAPSRPALCESWDAAEPGKGYAEKAAVWRAKLAGGVAQVAGPGGLIPFVRPPLRSGRLAAPIIQFAQIPENDGLNFWLSGRDPGTPAGEDHFAVPSGDLGVFVS